MKDLQIRIKTIRSLSLFSWALMMITAFTPAFATITGDVTQAAKGYDIAAGKSATFDEEKLNSRTTSRSAIANKGTLKVKNSSFTGNNANTANGGAIINATEDSTADFEGDITFKQNKAQNGGGVYNELGSLTFNGNTLFDSNTSTQAGGGLNHHGGKLIMTGKNEFIGNRSTGSNTTYGRAGALYNNNSLISTQMFKDVFSFAELHGENIFENNSAYLGGAIYNGGGSVAGGELWLDGTTRFTGNTISSSQGGGAIYNHNSTVKITGDSVRFERNRSEKGEGGAIENHVSGVSSSRVNKSYVYITAQDNYFEENYAGLRGGAVYNYDSEFIISGNNYFNKNQAQNGGAIANRVDSIYVDAITNISGTTEFTGNISTIKGGAIYNYNSDDKTGKRYAKDATVNVEGTTLFSGNKGTYGGAIYNYNANLNVTGDTTFKDNHATTYSGGALYNGNDEGDSGSVTVFDGKTLFEANDSKQHGGAVYNQQGSVTFKGETTFTGNKTLGSLQHGAGIYNMDGKIIFDGTNTFKENVASGNGGGIYNYKEATIKGTTSFEKNEAQFGGALFNNTDAVATFTGDKAEFKGNTAEYGGAIYNGNGTLKLTADNNTFIGNSAQQDGGALYNNVTLGTGQTASTTISGNTLFQGNTAENGGGAIFNHAVLNLSGNVSFVNNEAGKYGGAIYNNHELNVTGGGVSMRGNKATYGSNLYNGTNGIATFTDIADVLDISDDEIAPIADAKEPLFDQSGTIYNAGTINFVNSSVALHNGVNTDSGLEEADRKIGTINIQGSTIDLGGANVAGEGVMYGKDVNIEKGSRIISHVGADGEAGRIVAKNVKISELDTTLSLVLSYADKLNEYGESREYKIIEAENLGQEDDEGNPTSNRFTTLHNKLYDVYDLGDGSYRLTSKSPCGEYGAYDEAEDVCVCYDGAVDVGFGCEKIKECRAHEVYESDTNTCTCETGFVNVGAGCEPIAQCGANETYLTDKNTCVCSAGFVDIGNGCEVKTGCDESSERYDESSNACTCKDGYISVGGMGCMPKAKCDETSEVWQSDNTCACAAGYVSVNGSCEQKKVCHASEVYDGRTNECACPSGTVKKDGVCVAPQKQDICEDCDTNESNTANAWLTGDAMEDNPLAKDIQNKLFMEYQANGASEAYKKALSGLAPDVSPLMQTHISEITRRMGAIVDERLHLSSERTPNNQRVYKMPKKQSNLWAQGMYGQSKYNNRKGWDMDTKGIAIGFDGYVDDDVNLGVAYAYTNADGTSVERDTEIKSHSIVAYGQYEPSRLYANWLGLYTRSSVSEDKQAFNNIIRAKYDVDAYGLQGMVGYKTGPFELGSWTTGVLKPQIGARYIYTKQHRYTDAAGQVVGAANGQTLTGIVGAEYGIGFKVADRVTFFPELKAALTYDVVEPNTKMRVHLLNGNTYAVKTENMDRFGVETGVRMGLDVDNRTEIALEYEGVFKGDYKNHSGLLSLKYKF